MLRGPLIHELNDWSELKPDYGVNLYDEIDLSSPELNFGIHKYKEKIWTSGFVGVGRIYNKDGKPINTDGKENIVVIKPQYDVNPWKMLEDVIGDDEYEQYIAELENEGKFLFKVLYDQPVIKLAQGEHNDADILYALSFISSCYSLCKKGLKKAMYHQEQNFNSKVRGRVDVKKNIRLNTSKGRNDRFYCKYIDFKEDNVENRILKATLKKCKEIIGNRFSESKEISKRIHYCNNSLRHVQMTKIKSNDFNNASVSGLYTYYKPSLRQARSLLSQKYHTYRASGIDTVVKATFTIPYMINMETLFEFHSRTIIKRFLQNNKKYRLEKYSKKIYLEKGGGDKKYTRKVIHLMPYCIPDIIVKERNTDKTVAVIDAKYKAHNRSSRNDTLQLLSYVLLTGAKRCGFIFPSSQTKLKEIVRDESHMLLHSPIIEDLKYYEILLSSSFDNSELIQTFESFLS